LLQLQRHLPGDVMLSISALHLRSLHLAVQGQCTEALAVIAQVHGVMTPGYSQGWRRTYAHVQARIHWRSEDAHGLAALLPELTRPRSAREWPVLDTGAALVQGQHALLRSDLAVARESLERAAVLQRGARLPAFMGDARVALAACRADQGELDAAATVLDEVLSEAIHDGGLGLLLEPSGRLRSLWRALESRLRCPAAAQTQLRRRLEAWQAEGTQAEAVPPDDPLSAREREVLALMAEGQSNKLIARGLGLSLHTVKRHVANILTKLALDSRIQAAAYWHRR
jgi:LuxR family maltose regulon positive regulatory protein